MVKRGTRTGGARGGGDGTWAYHAENLLEHLNAERDRLAEELEQVDERINTVSSVLRDVPAAGRAARASGAGSREGTIAAAVLDALAKHGSMHVPELVRQTGYKRQQVYPSLMNLKKHGKVKAESRGVYALAGRGSARGAPSAGRRPARRSGAGRPAGESSTAVVKLLKRRGPLTKDQIVSATGLSRRQVHACLMSLARGNRVKAGAKGVYRLRKRA
jgi:predicted Rossmann fold nucleotide-binding protein DprA/Smf involved in DNA uptake